MQLKKQWNEFSNKRKYNLTEYKRLENYDSKAYVKPCEEGKYCDASVIIIVPLLIIIFEKIFTNRISIKVYNEEYTSKFDYDTDLIVIMVIILFLVIIIGNYKK